MACSLKSGSCVYGFSDDAFSSRRRRVPVFCCSFGSSRIKGSNQKEIPLLTAEFMGKQVVASERKDFGDWSVKSGESFSAHASGCVSRALRWWDKSLRPNMLEISSAQELVSSLLHAGDKLVVVDFYSPGCGGCRALHPKISQLAELYPDAIFLKVNYEELRSMCQCLHIHVLPFFRFYRGAEGRVCSFSCTNATIKKFKDALAKHGTDRCSIGPAKGLDDSELLKLASCGELSMDFQLPHKEENRLEDFVVSNMASISEAFSVMATKEEQSLLLS